MKIEAFICTLRRLTQLQCHGPMRETLLIREFECLNKKHYLCIVKQPHNCCKWHWWVEVSKHFMHRNNDHSVFNYEPYLFPQRTTLLQIKLLLHMAYWKVFRLASNLESNYHVGNQFQGVLFRCRDNCITCKSHPKV